MLDVLKHELSPAPMSLANVAGTMKSTPKLDLLNILTTGIIIPTEVPNSELKTCVIIDGHALIETLGKPHDSQTFGDYTQAFVKSIA